MKNVKISSGNNWQALSPEYVHDDVITFNNREFLSKEGVGLTVNNTLSTIQDETTNNYSKLMLTDATRASDIMFLNVSKERYPDQFTTYIASEAYPYLSNASEYLKVVESTDEDDLRRDHHLLSDGTTQTWNTGGVNNSSYFTVTLLNENQLTVSHDDNYVNAFLTLSGSSLTTYFSGRYLDVPHEDQKFNYVIDRKNGYLILYKKLSGSTYYITSHTTYLSATKHSGLNWPDNSVFKIQPLERHSLDFNLNTNWVSYKSTTDQNNLDIDSYKSYKNIYNNFLFNTEYGNLTGSTLPVDITVLKNQLTPDYNQSRGNPFPKYVDCDFREYNKIFSGTNQIGGTKDLFIGYDAYTMDIPLPPDKVTYFHTPQDMFPVNRLNINDSGLIEAGAIGADSPIKADKIFKKAGNYKDSTPWGAPSDEETGVWLCSWLKTNIGSAWNDVDVYKINTVVNFKDKTYKCLVENKNKEPDTYTTEWEYIKDGESVWMDRYYNPGRFSLLEALTVTGEYNEYVSKFEYITKELEAEDLYIFDKKSDLTFEPGCLYAYYRIGQKETRSVIGSNKEYLVQDGFSELFNSQNTSKNYTTDEADEPIYIMDGDTYGKTLSLQNTRDSDFTVSFWIHSDSWESPMGSQIIGNYVNDGFGVFNKLNTTPYITITDSLSTYVCNSDLDIITTIPLSSKKIERLDGSENLHIYNDDDGGSIYQYTVGGRIVEKTDISDLSAVDISIDQSSIYVLRTDPTEAVTRLDISSEEKDVLYTGTKSVGNDAKDTIVAIEEGQYTLPSNTHTVDMSGNIWYAYNGYIRKYDTTTSTTLTGLSSTNTLINGVKTDYDDNLWVLLSYYSGGCAVYKYNNNRELIFKKDIDTSLSSQLSGVSMEGAKCFDIITEFAGAAGYRSKVLILNQDSIPSTSLDAVTIDTAGNFLSYTKPDIDLNSSINSLKNISNYDKVKNIYKDTINENHLTFKLRFGNYFNTDDTNVIDMKYNVSEMSSGWHHFAYNFNSVNSNIGLYVDGSLLETRSGAKDKYGAKYKFTKTIHRAMHVGRHAHTNNISLDQFIGQSKYYFTDNIKVKGFKIYNSYLNIFDIKSLSREFSNIQPINLTLPTGKRNYLDHVTKFYKHKIPGRKAEMFNVNVITNTLTGSDIQLSLNSKILEEVEVSSPVNTSINKINWIK